MSMKRGQDGRALISGVAFSYARIRISDRNTAQNVSNSQGRCGNPLYVDSPGFVTKTSDLTEGQIELVAASFDPVYNLFGVPPALASGLWHPLLIYPDGLAGDPYNFGNCLLVELTHELIIPGLQPFTVRFETDGAYLLPGQT